MYEYGRPLYRGELIQKDKKAASHYHKLAADKGHIKSMFKY